MANASSVRERPLLMSAPMVRAVLRGEKTITRRVIRSFKAHACGVVEKLDCIKDLDGGPSRLDMAPRNWELCPYGQPGDRLWIRESISRPCKWDVKRKNFTGFYRATEPGRKVKWTPSIHMPRWASRITLEVLETRVERLQAITEEDAAAEGFAREPYYLPDGTEDPVMTISARAAFKYLWHDLNFKRGYGWNVNPWVWVVVFKRILPVKNWKEAA